MYSIIISIVLSLFCHTLYAYSPSDTVFDMLRGMEAQVQKDIEAFLEDNHIEDIFEDFLDRGTSYKENIRRHDRIKRSSIIPLYPDIYPFRKDMTIRHYQSFWNAFTDRLLVITRPG